MKILKNIINRIVEQHNYLLEYEKKINEYINYSVKNKIVDENELIEEKNKYMSDEVKKLRNIYMEYFIIRDDYTFYEDVKAFRYMKKKILNTKEYMDFNKKWEV